MTIFVPERGRLMEKQKAERFSFRFRRWSRKSYAVFLGLKWSISVGTLRFDMLRQLSKKNKNLILWSDFFALFADSSERKQVEIQLGNELAVQLCPSPKAGEVRKEINLYGNRAVEARNSGFCRFFIFSV